MTRMAPCAISLETIRKKVPYKGRTHRSDRVGKTHTALLETCTAPQNRRELKLMTEIVLFLQNFVFFKINDESEHSDSEFYYPGELSDVKLLQLPTFSESTEGKSTLLRNEEQKWSYDKMLID